jgi:hypothetical protein
MVKIGLVGRDDILNASERVVKFLFEYNSPIGKTELELNWPGASSSTPILTDPDLFNQQLPKAAILDVKAPSPGEAKTLAQVVRSLLIAPDFIRDKSKGIFDSVTYGFCGVLSLSTEAFPWAETDRSTSIQRGYDIVKNIQLKGLRMSTPTGLKSHDIKVLPGPYDLDILVNEEYFNDAEKKPYTWQNPQEYLGQLVNFAKQMQDLLNGALSAAGMREIPDYAIFLQKKHSSDIFEDIEKVAGVPIISVKKESGRTVGETSKRRREEDLPSLKRTAGAPENQPPVSLPKPKETSLESTLGFNDVAGCDAAKAELETYIDFVQEPAKYLMGGVRAPRGAILYGPPGTGKTLLAKVVAAQTRSNFYEISAEDFISKWYGESERGFANLLKEARSSGNTVLFFDEFDAIAAKPEYVTESGARRDVLMQLRKFIDGFTSQDKVYVIGATNHIDHIDEAITSRLKPIEVTLPDLEARKRIIELEMSHSLEFAIEQSRAYGLSDEQIGSIRIYVPELNTSNIAQAFDGLSGRDIYNVNEALKRRRIQLLPSFPDYLITTSDFLDEVVKHKPNQNERGPMGFRTAQ